MKIGVIGSINIDILYHVNRPPKQGETMFGEAYDIKNGGKGANQAVILSSLEDDVYFLGAVGNDIFGTQTKQNFLEKNIHAKLVEKESGSGLAIIQLANKDNHIIVFKGANDLIEPKDIDDFFALHKDLEIIVSQAEINTDTVTYLIEKAYEQGIKTILNPAPATDLKQSIIDKVDYLIPNEIEAEMIFHTDDLRKIVDSNKGKVIITLGDQGAMYYDGQSPQIMPAIPVDVIDTTGAGDSFIAGFTSGIAKGLPIEMAIRKGIEVAAITCTFLGAQSSYLKIREVFNS